MDPHQTDPRQDEGELQRILQALRGDTAYLFTFVDRCGAIVASMLARVGAPEAEVEVLVHEVALAVLELVATWDPQAPATDLLAAAVGTVWPRPAPGPGRSTRRPTRPDLVLVEGCGRDPSAGGGRTARTLHLVDIENLAGGPDHYDQWFEPSLRGFRAVAEVGPEDQVVMAADVRLHRRTAFEVHGCRYLPARGRDGADRRLLDAAPPDWVVARFDRLVVGSGDHCFAPLVAATRAAGIDTVVVARPQCLSHALAVAADHVRYLPDRWAPLVHQPSAA